jgi:hypothetical protein
MRVLSATGGRLDESAVPTRHQAFVLHLLVLFLQADLISHLWHRQER